MNINDIRQILFEKSPLPKEDTEMIYKKYFVPGYAGIRAINKFLHVNTNNMKILDVGCSYGQHLINFSKKSIGIDVNPNSIKFAKSIGLNVIKLNVENNEFIQLNEKFDLIFAVNIIEHLIAPHKFLLDCRKLLHDNNGKILIGFPNMDNILNKGWKAKEHIYAFNEKSMKFLLNRSGYKIIKVFSITTRTPLTILCNFQKLLKMFLPQMYIYAKKDKNFRYPKKRLDIFKPKWIHDEGYRK